MKLELWLNPVFETREEAAFVLNRARDILNTNGVVTFKTIHQLVTVDTWDDAIENYANLYGWVELDSAYVEKNKNGWYEIKFPRFRKFKELKVKSTKHLTF